MSDNAYKMGRTMVWSKTAGLYMRSFELARRQGAEAPANRSPSEGSPLGRMNRRS